MASWPMANPVSSWSGLFLLKVKSSASDFRSHFSMSKNRRNLSMFVFMVIEEYKKGSQTFTIDIFSYL